MKTDNTNAQLCISNATDSAQLHGALGNVLVAVAGGVLVLAGFVTLFLPGPGLLMMLGGLSLLASRFVFARRWLNVAQNHVDRIRSRFYHA